MLKELKCLAVSIVSSCSSKPHLASYPTPTPRHSLCSSSTPHISTCVLSGLMGIFEKRRFRNFLSMNKDFDESDRQTWPKDLDLEKCTMKVGYY